MIQALEARLRQSSLVAQSGVKTNPGVQDKGRRATGGPAAQNIEMLLATNAQLQAWPFSYIGSQSTLSG